MIYPRESFSAEQQERLRNHFTSLDSPVFGLVNLPETVKAAMFARYSRYEGTLKQLFLEEFADSVPDLGAVAQESEGERAARLFERVFVGFGDDSVAQLGGAHLGAEWCSNLLTKILQRPRIASYLEQSTRYIPFDRSVEGLGYRFYRDEQLGPEYEQAMNQVFEIYSALLPQMEAWAASRFPRSAEEPEAAWQRAIRAKALDLVRGLLPASTLSHMGIYASGQTYESLVMHLLAHPLPEARNYGEQMLVALEAMIPSFLSRVRRPDRGGVWIEYLAQRRAEGQRWADKLGLRPEDDPTPAGPSVRLLDHHGDERQLLASLLFEQSGVPEEQILSGLSDAGQIESAIRALSGQRENRRHRPGRGLERVGYRFEVVSDYGAFRDLQRHRMLTLQWQRFTPHLGAEVPPEVTEAGLEGEFRRALDISQTEYQRLRGEHGEEMAAYALCLAYRIRYVMDMNAREAMHLIELRSGAGGHPAYRAVALEMERQISQVHPVVGALMSHVDRSSDARLERIGSEIRNEQRKRDS